jgi:peptide/nickel transport system permease protein
MMKYFLRRLSLVFFAWVFALIILFFLPRLMPVGPEALLADRFRLPEEAVLLMRKEFGLDLPITTQLLRFLQNVVFKFPPDFGYSYINYPVRVKDIILSHLPWTVYLMMSSLMVTFLLGSVTGIIAAWKRGTKLEGILSLLAIFCLSSPVFWISYILIIVFAFVFRVFPPAGAYSVTITSTFSLQFIGSVLRHSVLPMLAIVLTQAPSYFLLVRDNMSLVFKEDYVITAMAKGVKERTIVFKHVARNALLPAISLFGTQVGLMLGGQIMVEAVFSYPGVGKLIVDAILGLDYPVVIGFFYIIITLGIIMSIVTDFVYVIIDPRVRYG